MCICCLISCCRAFCEPRDRFATASAYASFVEAEEQKRQRQALQAKQAAAEEKEREKEKEEQKLQQEVANARLALEALGWKWQQQSADKGDDAAPITQHASAATKSSVTTYDPKDSDDADESEEDVTLRLLSKYLADAEAQQQAFQAWLAAAANADEPEYY